MIYIVPGPIRPIWMKVIIRPLDGSVAYTFFLAKELSVHAIPAIFSKNRNLRIRIIWIRRKYSSMIGLSLIQNMSYCPVVLVTRERYTPPIPNIIITAYRIYFASFRISLGDKVTTIIPWKIEHAANISVEWKQISTEYLSSLIGAFEFDVLPGHWGSIHMCK